MDAREKEIIYENIHSLRSLIDNLRVERDEIREAWERVADYKGKETHLMYMCTGDLRKLDRLIGKEKP